MERIRMVWIMKSHRIHHLQMIGRWWLRVEAIIPGCPQRIISRMEELILEIVSISEHDVRISSDMLW